MRYTILFVAALLGASCASLPDTPNPARNGLRVDLSFDTGAPSQGGVLMEDLWISTLTLHLDHATFQAMGPDGDTSIALTSAQTIDVLAGGNQDLVFDLVQGEYTSVELDLSLQPGAQPTLKMEGNVDEDAFKLNIQGELIFPAVAQSFSLGDGPDPQVHYGLDPLAWFADVDFEDATTNAQGVVTINPNNNTDLYATIRAQVAQTTGSFPASLGDKDASESDKATGDKSLPGSPAR